MNPAATRATRRLNPTGWSQPLGYDQGQLRTNPSLVVTVAGHGPIDEHGRPRHEGDVAAQLALALANVTTVLEEAGTTLADVALLRVHTTDVAAVLAAYDVITEQLAAVGATPPTTLVEVSALSVAGAVVEIDALAIR